MNFAALRISSLKRKRFLAIYNPRQNWIWPTYLINYITIHPSNPKVYQKLVQSCKYFFIKNPIIVVEVLNFNDGEALLSCNIDDSQSINLKRIKNKIWVTVVVKNCNRAKPLKFESSIFPKIHRIDAKTISFQNEIIFIEKFLLLFFKNAKSIILNEAIIKNEKSSIIPLEKIVEVAANAESIVLNNIAAASSFTTNTVDELWKLPHFSKIRYFRLTNIPETIDIEMFFEYIKKNQQIESFLYFEGEISQIYRNRLEAVIDEILGTESHSYKPPHISFNGLASEKYWKMMYLPR